MNQVPQFNGPGLLQTATRTHAQVKHNHSQSPTPTPTHKYEGAAQSNNRERAARFAEIWSFYAIQLALLVSLPSFMAILSLSHS